MEEPKTMLRKILPVDYPSVILSASSESQESGAVWGSIGLPIFTIEDAMVWIDLFERKNFTTYSSKENWTHDEKKSFFKRKFTCNQQATEESNGELTCEAYIEFTVKDRKENMTTLGCYLQDYPAQVTINFCHNHKIGMESAPPSDNLTAIFRAYFAKGHSPLTALFCHKCDLHSFYDADFYNVISQESVCPSINWCYQEYEKLFNQKYVEPSDIELIPKLKTSVENYNGKYAQKCAVLMDNPLVLSICTPLMKQVFNSGFADDRIIVRTLSSSKPGQKCPNLVLFLGSTPMGPFPFGMVFALTQNENIFQTCAKRNIDAGYELNVDYMDGGTLMLQDVCIKYANIFNILQVFDFVTENYVRHYEHETANFTCRKIADCEFVVSSLNTDFFINSELNTCTCQVMEFGRSCIHQYLAENHLESVPESYNTLAIDSLHAFQTILSYKIHYYSNDVGGVSNEDSAAFKELGSIIRHRHNGNSNMNSPCRRLVDSQRTFKLEESLFCLETTDFEYQTCDVDLCKENSKQSEKSTSIQNLEKGKAAREIAEFLDFEHLITSNDIEDVSSKTSEALNSERNKITLQSSGTDCIFDEGLHLLEESHIETDPNSLIKRHKTNKDLEIDYNINTTYDLYKVFNNEKELKAASYKPSNKSSSKPKCYINKKKLNLKRVRNGFQYGPDGSSNVFSGELVKKLFHEVYSNNYQPEIREFTFEPIKNVIIPNGAINFDSPNKSTFDLTTDKEVLTLSDPELSFLLKNPQVNIFLNVENGSNHSANATPIISSLNESLQSSTIIDLTLGESSKRVTRSRRTQTDNKKSISSDKEQEKNEKESRPKQLAKSKSKARGKLGEEPVQNKISISENCNKSVSPDVPRANGPNRKERSKKKSKKSDKRRVKNKHPESKSDNNPSILSQDTASKEEVRELAKELRKPTVINKLEMSENCNTSIASTPPAKRPRKSNKKSSKLPSNNKIKRREDGNKYVQARDAANMKKAQKSVNGLKEPVPINKGIMHEKCDNPIVSNPPANKPRKIKNKSAKLHLSNKIKRSVECSKPVRSQGAVNVKRPRTAVGESQKESEKYHKQIDRKLDQLPLNKQADEPKKFQVTAKRPITRPREIIGKSENTFEGTINRYKLRSSLNNSSYQDDESSPPAKRPRERADQFKLHSNINNDIKSMSLSPNNYRKLEESSNFNDRETYPRRTQRKLTERLQTHVSSIECPYFKLLLALDCKLDVFESLPLPEAVHMKTNIHKSPKNQIHVLTVTVLWNDAESLKITSLYVPRGATDDAYIDCRYDLEGEPLYDVKWYKDDMQFFRCMADGSVHEFPVEGVYINYSNHATVGSCPINLTRLSSSSAGKYKCEVSLDAPTFRTVSETKILRFMQSERRTQVKNDISSQNMKSVTTSKDSLSIHSKCWFKELKIVSRNELTLLLLKRQPPVPIDVNTSKTKMMRRLKPKSSSALHCGFVRNLKEMTQLNWDYPNRFEKINKQAKMGEPERELTSKSAQAEVFCSTKNRYQICTDNRPPHKIILEKPRHEQEKHYVRSLSMTTTGKLSNFRQLSLICDSPSPHAKRQSLKKQFSEDFSDFKDPWFDQGPEVYLNARNKRLERTATDKPPPIKIAWCEKTDKFALNEEVIIKKCKEIKRAPSVKLARHPSLEKDSILNSKHDLRNKAETVDKENDKAETKPNLQIFLAHNTHDYNECQTSDSFESLMDSRQQCLERSKPKYLQPLLSNVETSKAFQIRKSNSRKTLESPKAVEVNQKRPNFSRSNTIVVVPLVEKLDQSDTPRQVVKDEETKREKDEDSNGINVIIRPMTAQTRREKFQKRTNSAFHGTSKETAINFRPPLVRSSSAPSIKPEKGKFLATKRKLKNGKKVSRSSKGDHSPHAVDGQEWKNAAHTASEIVTMVSLISPSGSENEADSEDELKARPKSALKREDSAVEKTTTVGKEAANKDGTKNVSLRKTVKS
ncbi:hypothetical protein HUJ05_009657, partial [Dendroctonus ponderosae]